MTGTAAPKPDFTGEWQLNRQASALTPAVAAAVQSGTMRIEHREPTFECEMTIVMDGKPVQKKFEMRSDAGEVVATQGERRIVSHLRWEGDALVATWSVEGPSQKMTISFRYALEADGQRLRAAEELRGSDHDQDNAWVFERDRLDRREPLAEGRR